MYFGELKLLSFLDKGCCKTQSFDHPPHTRLRTSSLAQRPVRPSLSIGIPLFTIFASLFIGAFTMLSIRAFTSLFLILV